MHKRQIKTAQCSNCMKDAEIAHGTYQFTESGLDNVVLAGIEIIKCRHCGNEDPIIPAINELFRTIALALVCKPYRLSGEEVRYLRKYLGLTADKMSRLLHVDKTTFSKWENNDDPVGTQSDLAIRMVAMSLDKELRLTIADVVQENFEKIQFCRPVKSARGSRKKRVSAERPTITVDAESLSYAYA